MRSRVIPRLTISLMAVLAAIVVAACGSSSGGGKSGSGGSSNSASSGYGGYGSNSGGASSSSSSSSSSSDSTLKLAHTSKGTILVSSNGFTAYIFTADKPNRDHCMTTSGCLAIWPALTVTGKPTAGTGVDKSLIGTIKISGGHHQVTYAGHPLYRYTGDGAPADTGYIGATSFGGTWLAVNAAGKAVH